MKQTERAGGKTSFPCQMYSLACLICLNVLSSPCIKAKIDPVWKKFSKSRTGREMEDGEFAVFWIRKTGNQAAAGPLPLACKVIFCISSLRPMKKSHFFLNIWRMLDISVGWKVATTNFSYLIHQADNTQIRIIVSHSTFPL